MVLSQEVEFLASSTLVHSRSSPKWAADQCWNHKQPRPSIRHNAFYRDFDFRSKGNDEKEEKKKKLFCSPRLNVDDKMIPEFRKALVAVSDFPFEQRFLNRRLLESP